MRDLMTQTSSVLQITPTCQLQYSETERNNLPYSKLNQLKDLNLKLSQLFDQKQLPSTRRILSKLNPWISTKTCWKMKTGTTSSHRRVPWRHQRRQQRTLSQREVEILGWVHQYQQGPQLGLFSAMFNQHCSPPPSGTPVKCRTSTPMKEPSSRRPSTPTVETRSSCLKPDEKPAATPPDYRSYLKKTFKK